MHKNDITREMTAWCFQCAEWHQTSEFSTRKQFGKWLKQQHWGIVNMRLACPSCYALTKK